MPRVLAPLVLVLLWLMKIAASPHSLRIGECRACSDPRLTIVLLVGAVDVLRKASPGLPLVTCSLMYSVPPAFWKCSSYCKQNGLRRVYVFALIFIAWRESLSI